MRARRALAGAALALAFAAPSSLEAAPQFTRAQLESMVNRRFGAHAPSARRIVSCESHWKAGVVGGPNRDGTYDYGLFQLNNGGTIQSLGLTTTQALDPQTNIDAAYRLFKRRGWGPWTCS